MTENPTPSETLAAENRDIFSQIRRLVPPQQVRSSYSSRAVEHHCVYLSRFEDRETVDIGDIPEKFVGHFTLPLAMFIDDGPNDFDPVTTPFGLMPRFVLGPDGWFHLFANIYIFDVNGNAKKLERIIPQVEIGPDETYTLEKACKDVFGLTVEEARANGMREIDFIPSEEDERLVDLVNGDYEKIHSLLGQIERGEWNAGPPEISSDTT